MAVSTTFLLKQHKPYKILKCILRFLRTYPYVYWKKAMKASIKRSITRWRVYALSREIWNMVSRRWEFMLDGHTKKYMIKKYMFLKDKNDTNYLRKNAVWS